MLSKTKRNSNVTSPKKSIPANQNVSPADTWGVFVSPITDCVIATFCRSAGLPDCLLQNAQMPLTKQITPSLALYNQRS